MKRVIFCIWYILSLYSVNVRSSNIDLNWQIGYHQSIDEFPEKWMPSTVPGAVQLDVMKAENYRQPYWYGDNFKQFNWMEEVYFTYKTNFKRPLLKDSERLFFFSKGIDYQFRITMNGHIILEQEGMFTYVDIDLTDYLQETNELKILLYPIPNRGIAYQKDYLYSYHKNAGASAKPAVSYGWDWHPRLVTRGIWDEIYLCVRNNTHIKDVSVTYELNSELTQVRVQLCVEGVQLSGHSFKWVLKDPEGKIVMEKQGTLSGNLHIEEMDVASPALWWPNGYGQANLYTNEFYLLDKAHQTMEQQTAKIGFRKIRLIRNEGTNMGDSSPATQPVAPFSLEINKRRIFCKGTNWVHPEIFPGLITPELYRKQIELAKKAHFNILRVWGGGVVNKKSFFDICDELGILVWQDFPLACDNYSEDVKYLKILEQEARSIVQRVKKHACLAIWCGGNELFWHGMTEQSQALRLLNSVCYQLDPYTPFIYTSPIYGIGHGNYVFEYAGEHVFQWMPRAGFTAYVEFGVPGAANISVLKSFIPKDELFPPKPNTAWETHHGFGAYNNDTWLEMSTLEKYFGKIKTLDDLVAFSQLLQCEGLKFIYEEARRQKPYCSMALNWCYQEPWPSAANNSLINWPNEIKPAYYHVANACRPVLASVRIPKFEWQQGEDFSCEPFILNDTYQTMEPVKVTVTLMYDHEELTLLNWDFPGAAEFQNVKGPIAHVKIPEMKTGLFAVQIKVAGKKEYNSTYVLSYADHKTPKRAPSKEYYNGATELKTETSTEVCLFQKIALP